MIGARDPDARLVLTSIASQRHSPAAMMDREFSFRSHAPAHRIDYSGLSLHLNDVELAWPVRFSMRTRRSRWRRSRP